MNSTTPHATRAARTEAPAKLTVAEAGTLLRETVVGVPTDTHPYWLDLLSRCGVAVETGPAAATADLAFIPPEAQNVADTRAGWTAAGIPVLSGLHADAATGCRMKRVRIAGLRGTGPVLGALSSLRIPTRSATADGNLLQVGPKTAERAPWIGLPLPQATAALATPPAMHRFSIDANHSVQEIVSGCDHGGLRRLIQRGLAWLGAAHGRPLRRRAHHPEGHSGTFAMRIDADDFDPDATASVAAALRDADLVATWFIDVERHERKGGGDAVRALAAQGDEVQSHFYHHYTYRSATRNQLNLRRSREVLRSWGIETTAAVTPFGTYHDGVATALRCADVAWSSEFSAHYDDVPSRCHSGVQVPVHPVCPILLLQAGMDAQDVVRYFTDRLATQLAAGEPALFYGHPIRDLAAVPGLFRGLREVLNAHEAATGSPVWQPSLGAFKQFDDQRWARLHGAPDEDAVPAALVEALSADGPLTADSLRPWHPERPRALRAQQRSIVVRRWIRETRRNR